MNTIKQSESELFVRYKKGDNSAKVELLTSLKPVIVGQVNKFKISGLPVDAIHLEAVNLASQAIDTYDPKLSQLNTHVTNYLKKISRFVTDYQNVGHIPEPRALMIGKYNTIYSNLESDLGREPTIYELADSMQIPPIEIERLQTELRKDLSMQIDDSDEESGGFYSFLKPDEVSPELKQAMDFVYFDSDPIDQKIMDYIFGMHHTMKKNDKEIMTALNLTDADLRKRKQALAEQIKSIA